ncbi:MAG: hypothetical protein AAF193_07875, partial [Bacteroidota bacterium]
LVHSLGPEAINYTEYATTDDGSCEYPFVCDEGTPATLYICTFSNGNNVALELLDSEGNSFFTASELGNVAIMYEEICLPAGCLTGVMSNLAGENGWYNGYFWIEVDGETIYQDTLNENASVEEINFSLNGEDCGECECTDEYAPVCAWTGNGFQTFTNECVALCEGYWEIYDGDCDDITGCGNPDAINYDPNVVIGDGSCEFDYVYGCMDGAAVNYNSDANIDDGSCTYDACVDTLVPYEICYDNNAGITMNYVNTQGGAILFEIISGEVESAFDIFTLFDTEIGELIFSGDGDLSGLTFASTGSEISLQLFSDGIISCADGNLDPIVYTVTCVDGLTLGCTDPEALNYNEDAEYDDGSCEYPVYGCTDPEANNYNPFATIDDGSCYYPVSCDDGTEAVLYICTFGNGNNVALDLVDQDGNVIYSGSELGDLAIMYEDICLPEGCLTAIMSNTAQENGWYNGYFWIQVDGQTIYTNALDNNEIYETVNFSANGTDCGECECDDLYDPVCVWDGF